MTKYKDGKPVDEQVSAKIDPNAWDTLEARLARAESGIQPLERSELRILAALIDPERHKRLRGLRDPKLILYGYNPLDTQSGIPPPLKAFLVRALSEMALGKSPKQAFRMRERGAKPKWRIEEKVFLRYQVDKRVNQGMTRNQAYRETADLVNELVAKITSGRKVAEEYTSWKWLFRQTLTWTQVRDLVKDVTPNNLKISTPSSTKDKAA